MKLHKIDGPLGWRIAVGVAILTTGVLLLLWVSPPLDDENKPKLALMSSLPLIWPEGGVADAIENDGDALPVKARLEKKFNLLPVDDLSILKDPDTRLLLLAQPRAFTAAELVDLERWVAAGGNVIILADPALQWESSLPLGDPQRPLFTSLLSPLFTHWGLALTLPMDQQDDQKAVEVDDMQLQLSAYGAWERVGNSNVADCKISEQAVLAECQIGAGKAVLLADADLLAEDLWIGTGLASLIGSDGSANMDWLERRLLSMVQ